MAIMARLAYASGVDVTTLLALRFGIAAAMLVAISQAQREGWPRGRTLASLILLGGLGYGSQAFTFFTALTLAPAGVVALLLYLYPALARSRDSRRDDRAVAAPRRRVDTDRSRAARARGLITLVQFSRGFR
jgi:hypothetical protein